MTGKQNETLTTDLPTQAPAFRRAPTGRGEDHGGRTAGINEQKFGAGKQVFGRKQSD